MLSLTKPHPNYQVPYRTIVVLSKQLTNAWMLRCMGGMMIAHMSVVHRASLACAYLTLLVLRSTDALAAAPTIPGLATPDRARH